MKEKIDVIVLSLFIIALILCITAYESYVVASMWVTNKLKLVFLLVFNTRHIYPSRHDGTRMSPARVSINGKNKEKKESNTGCDECSSSTVWMRRALNLIFYIYTKPSLQSNPSIWTINFIYLLMKYICKL